MSAPELRSRKALPRSSRLSGSDLRFVRFWGVFAPLKVSVLIGVARSTRYDTRGISVWSCQPHRLADEGHGPKRRARHEANFPRGIAALVLLGTRGFLSHPPLRLKASWGPEDLQQAAGSSKAGIICVVDASAFWDMYNSGQAPGASRRILEALVCRMSVAPWSEVTAATQLASRCQSCW